MSVGALRKGMSKECELWLLMNDTARERERRGPPDERSALVQAHLPKAACVADAVQPGLRPVEGGRMFLYDKLVDYSRSAAEEAHLEVELARLAQRPGELAQVQVTLRVHTELDAVLLRRIPRPLREDLVSSHWQHPRHSHSPQSVYPATYSSTPDTCTSPRPGSHRV